MTTIHEIKKSEVVQTPLLLFECTMPNGVVERWSTHRASMDGHVYEARVLRHNLFEIRAAAAEGVDAASRVSVTLANADSRFSQLHRTTGWKGAKLSIRFAFYDLHGGAGASESAVVFQGVCNPPDEITEATMRLTFTSRMDLQRILLPDVRIQRRCPWVFPSNEEQRAEAVSGGRYSPYYRCGYSADQPEGCGNPGFTTCDYTRAQCEQRGMFDRDSQNRVTRRFGGIEFVPSTISVKAYGEKESHASGAVENESRYNDFVPIVYGTAWYRPPIVFARNDGNLTRMEVLLGCGEIQDVLKVVVNGSELPDGTHASSATATGWYNVVSYGSRNGEVNADFPTGDPYGSMAVLSAVVPNRISDGSPLPRVEVLLQGLKIGTWSESGEYTGESFTNNPAWILLDLLRRTGWQLDDIDVASFGRAAAYCAAELEATDLHGTAVSIPRFGCNVVVRRRRSAADVIRGVRNSAGLVLTYGAGGRLQLLCESSVAVQQPVKAAGTNSAEQLNGGWPAYEFGDGTSPFSDILRRDSGEPAFRVWCRSTAETPNRYTVEFQDQFNEYQQDSLSLVDLPDATATGHEVTASLTALGIPNFNQAGRLLRLALDRSVRGNVYIEFEAGLRSIGLKPGDLITVTYAKEGFERQPFRVVRIAPSMNYQTATITAQWHDDTWYTGDGGSVGLMGGGREPGVDAGVPRPLGGVVLDEDGNPQFTVEEGYRERADGTWDADLTVGFAPPSRPSVNGPSMPLVSLAADLEAAGGTLAGGRSYYYAVSALNENGAESGLSFLVRAALPAGLYAVTLKGLSFAAGVTAFHVYRGQTPAQLLRIASDQPVATTFRDEGAAVTASAPPDRNYHHANFYWRFELLPAHVCSAGSATTVGNESLGMLENEYRGKMARITRGRGAGQERPIVCNDSTTLTVITPWEVVPDETSSFAVVETGWNFGAVSEGRSVTFTVPNRQYAAVHISGRSANVMDRECAFELSPLTRHEIGRGEENTDVPDGPVFGLHSAGQGTIELAAIAFEDMKNTGSISSASLTLHCWDELNGVSSLRLVSTLDAASTSVVLSAPVNDGVLVQIGAEVMVVQSVDGTTCEVERGAYGSVAAAHQADSVVIPLQRKVAVIPFVRGFFGTPASGSYAHTVVLPNVRVVAAELFVTNGRGNSQVSKASYAGWQYGGIRTLTGGQIVMQVDGPLAIQSNAVPPIPCDGARAIRDVFASVAEVPFGGAIVIRVLRDGQPFGQELTIASGASVSNVLDGRELSPLSAASVLGLDVVSLPYGENTSAGAGLTVTIRF